MKKSLVWFRRDLRLHDNHALSYACQNADEIFGVFVFDEYILSKLLNKNDQRLSFIIDSLIEMESELNKHQSSLHILYGKPEVEIPKLVKTLGVDIVVANRDYEPYAKKRDAEVAKNVPLFKDFKDQVIFEKHEVLTQSRGLFKVFTPYKNQWLTQLSEHFPETPSYPVTLKKFKKWENPNSILKTDWYQKIGFQNTSPALTPGRKAGLKLLVNFEKKITDYKTTRDFPAIGGTSNLAVHFRFGTISIREALSMVRKYHHEGAKTWLSELVWRDFYHMILDAHPYVVKESFKREYDQIKWLGGKKEFEAWKEGKTGFPIVDAAMRCFAETGMMHNRLRMIVASFLCKILLVNWREGEKYFAQQLLDFDLAANNGGWQWSSSSGCDAQPYFRIFNPYTQSEKFDGDGKFIREWIPELAHLDSKQIHRPDPKHYAPICVYEEQRKLALKMYSIVKKP